MNDREGAAATLEDIDVLSLEKENRELASKQVRQINDTLKKVRRISRESQSMLRPVDADHFPTEPAPAMVTEELVVSRHHDSRREMDEEATDKFLIPEPVLVSPVSAVFLKAFEMFERECSEFRFTRGKNSPVIRTWKLA